MSKRLSRLCKAHYRAWDSVDPETAIEEVESDCPWCKLDRLRELCSKALCLADHGLTVTTYLHMLDEAAE